MTRPRLPPAPTFVVAALAVLAAGRAAGQERTPPVFSADVDVIAVDVNVVDKQGRPVRGLGPEDFTVTVDGTPRRVLSADFVSQATEAEPEAAPAPDRLVSSNEGVHRGRMVVIVVDQGNIRPGVGRHALNAADRLLDALNPQDEVALVTMPGGGPQVELTSEHARVRDALKRIVGRAQYGSRRISLAEARAFDENRSFETSPVLDRECPASMDPRLREICINDVQGDAFSVMANFRHQSTVSMKGLALLMEALQKVEGPKIVVLITEGLSSERPDELRAIANAAASARVAFFGIHVDESAMPNAASAQPSPTAIDDYDLLTRDLFRLATLTRGAVFTTIGSSGPFERIAREISAYYLLGFEPQGGDRDGKDHVVDVKVAREGLIVRARRALPMAGPRLDAREALASTLRSPLPAVELPLRVTTYSSRDAASGKVRVVVSAEVGQGGVSPAGLSVGFALVDEKGKVAASSYQTVDADAPAAGRPLGYFGTALVDPGRYTLKLAAVDARGRRGSVEHPVRAVLTSIGGLEVSDLMVVPPASRPGEALRPAVEPALDGASAVGLVELHAADPAALAGAAVTIELAAEETGPALVSAPARVSDSGAAQRLAQGAVPLGLVPPGRYVARAVVSLQGRPVGQVTRPVVIAPSRTAASAGARPLDLPVLRFDRRMILSADVVAGALDALAAVGGDPSPAVAHAMAEARAGRLDRLGDLLSAGESPTVALAFLRGLGLLARGETLAAADQFRAALRLRPDFVPATVFLGAADASIGRDQDAVGAWNTALLEEARSPVVSLLLADALMRRGDPDAAIDVLREGAAAWPSDDRFRQRLGLAHAAAGRVGEALPLLAAWVEAHPADAETRFALVRVLYETRSAPGFDRAAFLRHARDYVAAAGGQQALVGQWIKAVESGPAPR